MADRITVTLPRRYIFRAGKRKEMHGPGASTIPRAMAEDLVRQGVLSQAVLPPETRGTVAAARPQAKDAGAAGYRTMSEDPLIDALEGAESEE